MPRGRDHKPGVEDHGGFPADELTLRLSASPDALMEDALQQERVEAALRPTMAMQGTRQAVGGKKARRKTPPWARRGRK